MFDYIYYRIYSIYKYKWKESIPGIYAICAVSILQFFNLICLQFLIYYITKTHLEIDKLFGALFVLILISVNYYRFFIHSNFEKFEDKWKDENKAKKKRNGVLIILYVVLSVMLVLFSADYFGSINRSL